LHHNEDEWLYVIEGEYIAEIGSERFLLKPGDSLLGPREMPHAWAFVGDTPGRMLIAFAPANKMEAFFRDNEKRFKDGKYLNDAQVYHAYGMELLGPPLSLG
jgi:quercetin dioxygenase-like cupin family protein